MDDLKQFIKYAAAEIQKRRIDPSFFEVLRRIEQMNPELPRIGGGDNLESECVRLGQQPMLGFPAGSLASLQESGNDKVPRLLVYFFGMLGVNGPMPLDFTAFVLQRTRNHYDPTWQKFLDLFHHRLLSLFFRAWEMRSLAASADRPRDDYVRRIACGLAGLPDDLKYRDTGVQTLLGYSVYNSNRCSSESGLLRLLQEYTRLPVRLIPFVPTRLSLPKEIRCRLGNSNTSILGRNSQIGSSCISDTKKFNVNFGPVSFRQYTLIAPGTGRFTKLTRVVAMYCSAPISFEFTFEIKSETVPPAVLGRCCTLGTDVWLGGCAKDGATTKVRSVAFVQLVRNSLRQQRHAYAGNRKPHYESVTAS